MGFMDLAKQGYEAYQSSQNDNQSQSQQHQETPSHPGFDLNSILGAAKSEHNDHSSEEHHSLFSSAASMLNENKHKLTSEPVDEQETQKAHDKVFGDTNESKENTSPHDIGMATALNLFKKHFSGGENQTNKKDDDLMGMVMAQASKIFDEKFGNSSKEDKKSAIDSATLTFGKLMLQSKLGVTTGSNNSGGLSQLAGMAQQFMK